MKDSGKYRILLPAFISYIAVLFYKTWSFIFTSELAGRDLIGAYSLVESFQFGWSTKWFLGFPMFKFYPPGFFFTADKLGLIIGDLWSFKLIIYLSLIVLPLTVYYCFNTIFDHRTGLVAFILSFSVVFLREPFSLIYQTLQVGLAAQAFALPFLFIYIGLIWKKDRDSIYLLGILMALMIISHPYVALVAAVYTGIYFILQGDFSALLGSALGFLLTAWWWIAVIEKSWYMQNYVGPTGKILNWPWIFLPLLLVDRSRKALSLVLLGVLLLITGTFSFGLEIQFYRFYIYGQILIVLAVAPSLKKSFGLIEDRISFQKMFGLLFITMLVSSMTVNVSEDWKSTVELEGVAPEEGRMIVETSHSDLHNSYVPIQQIPLETNVTVVNGLYADSSISSPYLLGLEKSFAENPIPNPIAVEANLTSEQLEKRFRYFGIEYALVRTDHAREKLSFMEKVSENKDFTLLGKKPENMSRQKYVPVHGSYSEWEKLNRYVFRNNLKNFAYTSEKGYQLEDHSSRELLKKTYENNFSYQIKRESIKPFNRTQLTFGLSLATN